MKYILKKEYPGSPKLGYIVTKGTLNWSQLKDYPEFWQPVVEKDYEILSLRSLDIIEDLENDDTINMLLKQGCSIHSVKRLSDGEIFTIGDNIANMCDSKQKISELYICKDGKMCVYTSTTCRFTINNIQKVKIPLFTSEDGVDIFDYSKDHFYYVKKESFKLCENLKVINLNVTFKYEPEKELYFSTKEKAEEYILYNKPLLTLKDIDELLCKNTSSYFLEKFKKRAQKLNNKN